MSRINLKLAKDTKDRLDALKRDGETWDGFFNRAANELEEPEDDRVSGIPRCSECGIRAHAWTVKDGRLLCADCADA